MKTIKRYMCDVHRVPDSEASAERGRAKLERKISRVEAVLKHYQETDDESVYAYAVVDRLTAALSDEEDVNE